MLLCAEAARHTAARQHSPYFIVESSREQRTPLSNYYQFGNKLPNILHLVMLVCAVCTTPARQDLHTIFDTPFLLFFKWVRVTTPIAI
jgi:hypothetical protein